MGALQVLPIESITTLSLANFDKPKYFNEILGHKNLKLVALCLKGTHAKATVFKKIAAQHGATLTKLDLGVTGCDQAGKMALLSACPNLRAISLDGLCLNGSNNTPLSFHQVHKCLSDARGGGAAEPVVDQLTSTSETPYHAPTDFLTVGLVSNTAQVHCIVHCHLWRWNPPFACIDDLYETVGMQCTRFCYTCPPSIRFVVGSCTSLYLLK